MCCYIPPGLFKSWPWVQIGLALGSLDFYIDLNRTCFINLLLQNHKQYIEGVQFVALTSANFVQMARSQHLACRSSHLNVYSPIYTEQFSSQKVFIMTHSVDIWLVAFGAVIYRTCPNHYTRVKKDLSLGSRRFYFHFIFSVELSLSALWCLFKSSPHKFTCCSFKA